MAHPPGNKMIFTASEILDLLAMTFFLGWLFSDSVKRPAEQQDVVDYMQYNYRGIKWRDIRYAAMVIAPGIILHEVAHKLAAMAFGAHAMFFAFYRNGTTMVLGIIAIVMKLAGAGFMLIVPGFVMHTATTPLQSAVIAFAGPFVHLAFWISSSIIGRKHGISRKFKYTLALVSRINMFLFIFNMLPIPGFDGFQVYSGLIGGLMPR